MRPKILLIDNYDSFTYNLVQAFLILGAEVDVHRNDAIGVDQALAQNYTHLVISPGPGRPRDAGVSMRLIAAFAGRIPIFGVCLGHQSLVEVFGGRVVRAARMAKCRRCCTMARVCMWACARISMLADITR